MYGGSITGNATDVVLVLNGTKMIISGNAKVIDNVSVGKKGADGNYTGGSPRNIVLNYNSNNDVDNCIVVEGVFTGTAGVGYNPGYSIRPDSKVLSGNFTAVYQQFKADNSAYCVKSDGKLSQL